MYRREKRRVLTRSMPLMLWRSRCSQPPWWMLSLGMEISGPLNTAGCQQTTYISCQWKPRLNPNLIHIIPNIDILRTFSPGPLVPFRDLEQRMPPGPAIRVEEINPGAAAGPAPAFVFLQIFRLDKNIDLLSPLIDGVVVSTLQMRVYDHNHLCH